MGSLELLGKEFILSLTQTQIHLTDMSQLSAAHPDPGKCENVFSNWKWVKEIIVHLSVQTNFLVYFMFSFLFIILIFIRVFQEHELDLIHVTKQDVELKMWKADNFHMVLYQNYALNVSLKSLSVDLNIADSK